MVSSPEQPQRLGAVVAAVKSWVERCSWVWVEGQVIEIKRRPGSMHYLTLRDRLAEVSVSLTIGTVALEEAGPLTEGATVVCRIHPTVFPRNGSLSFTCSELRPAGEGRLLAQLEQRKRTLQAEGLFDRARKKRLPLMPAAIGVVTAADSAAERDVIDNVRRRWPAARFEIRHVLVQGSQAAEQVIAAVNDLARTPRVEVIVIARGGGSMEDLLPFSDEGLVRAVHAVRTPVVSAIGHESDTPILDLVADVRASTPTDAAKLIVPDASEESRLVTEARTRLRQAVSRQIEHETRQLRQLRERPSLTNPLYGFELRYDQIAALRERGNRAIDARLRTEAQGLSADLSRVRAMSPKATLERGYAILADGTGDGVTSVDQVDPDDDLHVYLSDGEMIVSVREVRGADHTGGLHE